MKKLVFLLVCAALVLPLVGCKKKSPIEKAAGAAEEAATDVGKAIDDLKE